MNSFRISLVSMELQGQEPVGVPLAKELALHLAVDLEWLTFGHLAGSKEFKLKDFR